MVQINLRLGEAVLEFPTGGPSSGMFSSTAA